MVVAVLLLIEVSQSPHLPVEPIGSKLLVEINIQQQSRPMGRYGLGDLILLGNLELMIPSSKAFQSPPLPVGRIGNKFLLQEPIQQQSRLMGLYGLGVLVIMEDLELIILQTEVLQSPHLPEEPIGNRFLVEKITQQQSKPMGLYGLGVVIRKGNLELIIL